MAEPTTLPVEPTTLPVEAARPDFERALATDRPVVLVAPTGSGKSTRLPGWLAELEEGRVVVVEPRRVACRALAGYVARLRGSSLGAEVGYRVRFDDRSGPDTRILFVTPGVALNLLAAREPMGALLVDEFHERSWEVDLVVALARSRRAAGEGSPLVLCSATLDAASLVETLGAELVQARGRSFPVEVSYRGDGGPSADDLEWRVRDAVLELVRDGSDGDVLVFLPGKGEIERSRRALDEAGLDAELVPVHGGISPEKLVRAFEREGGGRRRIYLATNVAETSLTLPGVRVVVDSGLARARLHQAGRSVLALVSISRASMDQRAGRAGRVAAGRCVRLWSSTHAPVETTPPEIGRVELDDLVLRAAGCGLEGEALESAPWVTPPPAFALERAREQLRRADAIDEAGRVTARGREQAALPVSPDSARVLASAPRELVADLADLVALIEVGRDLLTPGPVGGRVEEARGELFAEARDEVDVQLAALRHGDERRHGLHRARVEEARRLARALRERLGAPRSSSRRGAETGAFTGRDDLVAHLLSRWPEAAFVRRARAERKGRGGRGRGRGGPDRRGPISEPWGNGELELALRPYRIPGLEEEEQPDPPTAGLVLAHEWLGLGRRARGVGRLLLVCTPAQLAAAGIGEVEVGDLKLERKRGRVTVLGTRVRRHAGVVLETSQRPLRDAELRAAVAALVAEGRLYKGLLPRLDEALFLQDLLHQQAVSEGSIASAPPLESIADRVRARLDVEGVASSEDLELLEPEDFLPDLDQLAAQLALDPRSPTALAEDFSPTWIHLDGRYRLEVRLEPRRVILRPDDARAKKVGEPKTRQLPRWRGFSVTFVQASRKLRLR